MARKTAVYSILIILFFSCPIYPVDIYISNLQGFYKAPSETDILSKKVEFISTQLKKELMQQTSDIISYLDLGNLARERRREYDAEPVTDTLDALAVCFFYGIDFVLFGELYLGGDDNQYKTQINVYSKEAGDIIHTIEYVKAVDNDITYAKGLASTINQELMVKFAGYSEDGVAADESRDDDSVPDQVRDNRDTRTDTGDSTDMTSRGEREDTYPPETGKKIFGLYFSLGYFFNLGGEWAGAVMPAVTLEEGVNWAIRLVDGETFDFYIRPSALFNYSFSLQDPYNTYHRYIHYHSFAFKANIDFFFLFNDFFGFFIGVGPQYRIDIIDFRTFSSYFYTDIPYALGVCGNAGVELCLSPRGGYNLGLNAVFDMTFYDTLCMDLKVFSYAIFRL